jgi:hypothetical protein
MTRKNPFPGMNPFFEQRWRDAHARLITYLNDDLQERLPPDLVARTEEEAVVIGAGGARVVYRPDVQIREPDMLGEPGAAEAAALPPSAALFGKPMRILLEEETHRWVEIRDQGGRLITVLELLSPANKVESAERDRYIRKRCLFLEGGANVVEIDLVRQGVWVFPRPVIQALRDARACYGVCVYRAHRPAECELYTVRLRDRLPVIRVPLRTTDADAALGLQPLIDQCHERGRYHLLNYELPLDPPLAPEDAAWAARLPGP